jgi:signal peptidase II
LLIVLALGGLVGCDHATKSWAETNLRGAPAIDLMEGVLDLRYTKNHDVAFNLLREIPRDARAPLLVVLGLVGIAAITVLLVKRREAPALEAAAFTMMLAGAIGNVADRIARGYVVDFIHLEYWPIFNFADVWLVMGMVLYLGFGKRWREGFV